MHLSLKRRSFVLCGLAALVPSTPFALPDGLVARPHLQLSGSTTMAPLMDEIAKRYARRHPAMQIDVRHGGSSRGIDDLRAGKVDIGMVARGLDDAETGLQGVPIARDGVALIVHRDNPVNKLSREQLAALYAGKIGNWRALGGRDARIAVLAGPPEGGSSELFSRYVQLPYERLIAQRRVAENAERIAAIVDDPNAVIFVSAGEAERRLAAGAPIKLLAIDGVMPSASNVRTQKYPIARPLMLVTRQLPSELARNFVDYCIGSQVVDLIRAFDFIPYLD
ncbi:MAG: phosphate ABC transporter substrate-binding protein [Pseudomonadota bacterium]